MNFRHIAFLSLFAIALGATALSAAECRNCDPKDTTGNAFLSPAPELFVLSEKDASRPSYCSDLERYSPCADVLVYDGGSAGGLPTIEGAFAADLPNVRVSFVVQEITHVALAGGGVEGLVEGTGGIASWTTTSVDADIETAGSVGWGLPTAGDTWTGGITVYDALVFGACGSLTSFDVEHWASAYDHAILNTATLFGTFDGIDNSTIDGTGYYNLHYTIPADDGEGGVSEFQISGKVNVVCSAANSL